MNGRIRPLRVMRRVVMPRLRKSRAGNKGELVPTCAACGRVRINGKWQAPETVEMDVIRTHGYCPACLEVLMLEVEAEETGGG